MPPVKKGKAKKQNVEEVEKKAANSTVVSGQLSKKLLRQQKKIRQTDRGVVLIKHLPHGFYEEQLKKYFEQFGTVTRLRLVRSRRTGGSKGFAFVEFEYPEVAQVAAETMDNYLMFQKLVKAAYIPPDKQLYNYFKTTTREIKNKVGKPIYVSRKTAAIKRIAAENNDWSEDNTKKRNAANLNKIKKLNDKYAHLGLDFSTLCIGTNKPELTATTASGVEDEAKPPAAKKAKKVKEEIALEALLGNTIQEDSDDEDWKTTAAISKKNNAKQPVAKKLKGTTAKKTKEDIDLADLLGNTIQEDSDDEDWNANESSEKEFAEVLYLDDNDSENNETDKENTEDDEAEDFDNVEVVVKKTKKGKPKEKKLEKLVKRKPQSGGVQKQTKKIAKKPTQLSPKPGKNLLLLAAAKEAAQPLTKINKKSNLQKKKSAKRLK